MTKVVTVSERHWNLAHEMVYGETPFVHEGGRPGNCPLALAMREAGFRFPQVRITEYEFRGDQGADIKRTLPTEAFKLRRAFDNQDKFVQPELPLSFAMEE